jgi:hypothetical protein
LRNAGAVVEQESFAIAAQGKRRIQHFCISQRLLHAVPDAEPRLFGLHNGDGDAWGAV